MRRTLGRMQVKRSVVWVGLLCLAVFLSLSWSDLAWSKGGGFSGGSRGGGGGFSSGSRSSGSSGFSSGSRSSGSSGFSSGSRSSSPGPSSGGRSSGSGFSSGGSPSSSSGFSSPGSSGSSSSGGFSGGKSSTGTSSGTSSSRSGTAPKLSASDKALYDKAKTKGTAYTSRDEAAKSFQSKYGSQYENKFTKEPATRPDWVPSNTTVGGRSYNITYNQGYGGYGYYGPSGAWVAYSVMSDMVMMDMLMHRHDYYYGPQPGYYGGGDYYGPPVVRRHYGPFTSIWSLVFGSCCSLLVLCFGIWLIVRIARSAAS